MATLPFLFYVPLLMTEEVSLFVEALEAYVNARLKLAFGDTDYLKEAVEIVDARNLLFREAGERSTDETENIYALAELTRPDEDTMEYVAHRGRIEAIARNFFW